MESRFLSVKANYRGVSFPIIEIRTPSRLIVISKSCDILDVGNGRLI